tara:strand:- start:275 stop:472 length:198 start_codon:yes stop_codon:yes gene_type:complete
MTEREFKRKQLLKMLEDTVMGDDDLELYQGIVALVRRMAALQTRLDATEAANETLKERIVNLDRP